MIFAFRMLWLFLVLPVCALEAGKYRGGDDPALVHCHHGQMFQIEAFLPGKQPRGPSPLDTS